MIQTAEEYKLNFGRDLHDDIKHNTSHHFQDLLLSRLRLHAAYDAYVLHEAIAGLGTDEHALIEVLATRNNFEIKALKEEYHKVKGKELEHAIIGDTSGHFKRILVSLVQAARHEDDAVDMAAAATDAKRIYEAGEAHWGTDESVFNEILATRSRDQLKAINQEYLKLKGQDLVLAVAAETSHHLKEAFTAIVLASINKEEYFADKLLKSMKGLGTDDRTLVRIIASRSEIDLVEIKEFFATKNHKSLARYIEEDCSGDYKKLLVEMVGEP